MVGTAGFEPVRTAFSTTAQTCPTLPNPIASAASGDIRKKGRLGLGKVGLGLVGQFVGQPVLLSHMTVLQYAS